MALQPSTTDVFSMARNNRYEELKKTINGGNFPIDTTDAHGNTLLLVACQNGLKRVVKLALRSGADINIQNNSGNTALHFCYLFGFGQALGKFLIEQGADETLLNHRQHLPHQSGLSGFGSLPPLRTGGACDNNNNISNDQDSEIVEEYFDDYEGTDNYTTSYSSTPGNSRSTPIFENSGYSYNDYNENYEYQEGEEGGGDYSNWNNQETSSQSNYSDNYSLTTPNNKFKVSTCFRSPPPSNKSKTFSSSERNSVGMNQTGINNDNLKSPVPIVKKSTNRRPPPTTPHPDVLQARRTPVTIKKPPPTPSHEIEPFDKKPKQHVETAPKLPSSTSASASTSTCSSSLVLKMPPKVSSSSSSSSTTTSKPLTDIGPPLALMEAMASSDYTALARAVQFASDKDIHAALLNGCARGNLKAVNILLSKSPEEGLIQGAFICARNGHIDILKVILEITNDIRTLDNSLVQASNKGHVQIIEYIVSLRKASSESLKRALLSAARKNHYKVIELLIPVVIWDDRKDALVLCCKSNYQASALLLIKSGLPGRFLEQPLSVCASKGHYNLIYEMLSNNSVLIDMDPTCITHASNIAYKAEHWKVVELLSQYNPTTTTMADNTNEVGSSSSYGDSYYQTQEPLPHLHI
mmetsp:Transcript_897/g.1153  ORF Transcript_897/g.1153 Transcript_897/m.1153 type:complete len:638 (+) Transcript_897:19-1932(+)